MLHCRMKQSEKKQVKWLMIMLNANARINDNELNWTNCQLTRQFERAKQAKREWKWSLDKQSVWERQRANERASDRDGKRESVWPNRARTTYTSDQYDREQSMKVAHNYQSEYHTRSKTETKFCFGIYVLHKWMQLQYTTWQKRPLHARIDWSSSALT